MLFRDRSMSVFPAPLGHCRQSTGVSAFGRYLPYYGPTAPRPAPHVSQAEEVERSTIHIRMVRRLRPSVTEVDEARLVGMERKPVPLKTLAQDREDPSGIVEVFKCHDEIVGVPDKGTSPPQARSHLGLEPLIQHIVQINVR
jgi:hypothetical protein